MRVLSTGHGRKTDEADAVSVGIAALTATRLNTAPPPMLPSPPCAPWWNTAKTWSKPAPKPSTGCKYC